VFSRAGINALIDSLQNHRALSSVNILGNAIPMKQTEDFMKLMSKRQLGSLCGLSGNDRTALDFSRKCLHELLHGKPVDSGHILALINHRKIKRCEWPSKPKKGDRVFVAGEERKIGVIDCVGGGGYWNRCKILYDDGSRNKEYDKGYQNSPYDPARGGWLIWSDGSGSGIDLYSLSGIEVWGPP
jgi:hypothetical protein